MKNIFYIANIRMPTEKAHGIQVVKMCEAFSNIGNNVELWVPNRWTKINENPSNFYGIDESFEIKKLKCFDVVHWGKVGYRIEMISFLFSCFIKSFFKSGIFYTREESVAVALSLLGKKVFWESHRGNINMFVKMIVFLKVPIVSISNGLKEFYVNLGVAENRILVAPDGVDLKQFQVVTTKEESRKRLNLPLDKKIVMYIGLFEDWKGYKTILEASTLILDDNIHFAMIGEGGNLEEFKVMYPNVTFVGYRPYKELPINQISADILLVPNSSKERISSHFTSPIKLFAHMTSGVPIVVSDLPSMREVVDESTATFFEPDNAESLAVVIKDVLLNFKLAITKTQKSLEKVKVYTWRNRTIKILEFIK